MWSFLKNKHDPSFDDDFSNRARLTGFDDNAIFTDMAEPSTTYQMRSLNQIQDRDIDSIAVYYDGNFTIIAQSQQ